jgi:hypothetical protein
MTNAHDPIKNVQSRIDELEQTISERGEQIKERTRQLKDDLQEELSPMELIKKHPVEAAGVSFVTGIIAGRVVRSLFTPKRKPAAAPQAQPAQQTAPTKHPSAVGAVIGAIATELLHTAKDLGITLIKNHYEAKKRKA